MAQSLPSSASSSAGQPRTPLPPGILEILLPSLQVGAGAGTAGLFFGAASGIIRSSSPVLFSLVSGAQWFTLGSTYYASRRIVIGAWGGDDRLSRADRVKASSLAGGCAGMIGGILRGPKNIVPGAIMFALFGAGGQLIANGLAKDGNATQKTKWLASKWSPLTALSDEQYEKKLEEKLLRIEAELALVDEKIAALRASQKDSAWKAGDPNTTPASASR